MPLVPGVAKWISGEAAAPVVVATWPLCCSWAVALVVGAYCPGGGYDVAPMWQLGQCAGVCLGVLAPSKAAPGSLQVASFACEQTVGSFMMKCVRCGVGAAVRCELTDKNMQEMMRGLRGCDRSAWGLKDPEEGDQGKCQVGHAG